jgi:hypothetical protein
MRLAVTAAAREVVAPVRVVLRDYASAHAALTSATPTAARSWTYSR